MEENGTEQENTAGEDGGEWKGTGEHIWRGWSRIGRKEENRKLQENTAGERMEQENTVGEDGGWRRMNRRIQLARIDENRKE